MEGEGAVVGMRSQTGNVLEKGIVKQLRWSLEEVGHQKGQTVEGRARSKDLQEGFQVKVG